ncbi:hypothetical protein [Pseudomonas coleopterorum]|uniref:Lipoprotein n=1 Tax=Pseudomonas coleopterorum TaxID=1605838 RepID=A0ABR9BW78_9PSED|nr:hypothetical protein [Pseudomonas coleopterorum]MBD8756798.1 hypothetical protein [Pseudomonas coleopterorum]MBD8769351.1 hypothetical protein [Pseudomonas coleopterorum]
MLKVATLALVIGLLAGCSGAPATSVDDEPAATPGGCSQSQWQAESIPVVGKRMGPEALERYEPEQQAQAPGCP